jgi:hypothetical protein
VVSFGCVRACGRAGVRACGRAGVRVYVCMCACARGLGQHGDSFNPHFTRGLPAQLKAELAAAQHKRLDPARTVQVCHRYGKQVALSRHALHSLHSKPNARHPIPYALNPAPDTLPLIPYALNPTPDILHPTPFTLHPTPYTPEP